MARYKDAIDWIARNDDFGVTDIDEFSGLVTVCLVADLFGKNQYDVAKAVFKLRDKEYPGWQDSG